MGSSSNKKTPSKKRHSSTGASNSPSKAVKATIGQSPAASPSAPASQTPVEAEAEVTARETTYTHLLPTSEQKKGNGRRVGRSLIMWNRPRMAEKLLLHLHYECTRHKVQVPWDAVAHRLRPSSSGAAIMQHMNRLRKDLLLEGHLVPPLAQKTSTGTPNDATIRGYVRADMHGEDKEALRAVKYDEKLEDAKFNLPDSFSACDDNELQEDNDFSQSFIFDDDATEDENEVSGEKTDPQMKVMAPPAPPASVTPRASLTPKASVASRASVASEADVAPKAPADVAAAPSITASPSTMSSTSAITDPLAISASEDIASFAAPFAQQLAASMAHACTDVELIPPVQHFAQEFFVRSTEGLFNVGDPFSIGDFINPNPCLSQNEIVPAAQANQSAQVAPPAEPAEPPAPPKAAHATKTAKTATGKASQGVQTSKTASAKRPAQAPPAAQKAATQKPAPRGKLTPGKGQKPVDDDSPEYGSSGAPLNPSMPPAGLSMTATAGAQFSLPPTTTQVLQAANFAPLEEMPAPMPTPEKDMPAPMPTPVKDAGTVRAKIELDPAAFLPASVPAPVMEDAIGMTALNSTAVAQNAALAYPTVTAGLPPAMASLPDVSQAMFCSETINQQSNAFGGMMAPQPILVLGPGGVMMPMPMTYGCHTMVNGPATSAAQFGPQSQFFGASKNAAFRENLNPTNAAHFLDQNGFNIFQAAAAAAGMNMSMNMNMNMPPFSVPGVNPPPQAFQPTFGNFFPGVPPQTERVTSASAQNSPANCNSSANASPPGNSL